MSIRGTAAGNSIVRVVKDRAAAKFSKGVKGVDVSRSEAGRARAIEHLCPDGDPLSKFVKILDSKKRLFWTPEIRGIDPFSVFLEKKTGRRPISVGEKGPFARFSTKIKEIPLYTGASHGYKGGAMTQTRCPRDKDILLWTKMTLCPFFYSRSCPKAFKSIQENEMDLALCWRKPSRREVPPTLPRERTRKGSRVGQ
jgi:hypothetical protein